MKTNITTILLLICCFLPSMSWSQKNQLKQGDVLFISLSCGPMCDAIDAVTSGYNNIDFNHMGLVTIDAQQQFFVYEAIGKAVVKTPLNKFLAYTKKPIYKGRLRQQYRKLIPEAIAFCESQLGVPYDNDFIYNNGKYYCSELLYDAFLQANGNTPFFQLFPMTYKEPGSAHFFPVWVNHFEQQGIPVPEGQLGCNPGGMSLDKKIKVKRFFP